MSAALDLATGSLVTYRITADGESLPDAYQILNLNIERSLNRIACAKFQILDGNAAEESFTVSSADTFIPGALIDIALGYDGKNNAVFSGIVTRQRLVIDEASGSRLEVECNDKAIKLTIGRNSACHSKKSDSEVMSSLIEDAGLKANVSSTDNTYEELVQNYCSDWDFLLSRADVNGLVVSTLNGTVSVFKYDKSTSPVGKVVYGNNLHTFDADLNSLSQYTSVKASAWDYKEQKLVSSEVSNTVAGAGNLSSSKLASVADQSIELQSTVPLTIEELSTWATAQMRKSEYNKISGELTCDGDEKFLPGSLVNVSGLGARFDGDLFISGVTHQVEDGNWVTELQLGIDPAWFVASVEAMAPSASGLLPGITGLMNATVIKNYEDPDGEFRVLVDLPLVDKSGEGIWARLGSFYASAGFGAFFQPEQGDEVIVCFLNEDPRFPVVLGSLYSSKRKSWEALLPDEKNTHKGIVTSSLLRILFDDEKKILTIETQAGNQIVLDDDQKQITITDQNENKMSMTESGIDLDSPKSITIKATESVTIQGDAGVTIQSETGDVSISGINVKASADAEFSASGEATASVEGGGELTLKAAMVMIN